MKDNHWIDLQFFAGEGAAPGGEGGGEGSAVVNAADDGQDNTLEKLGVPRDKAERYRKRKTGREGDRIPAAPAEPRNDRPATEQVAGEPAAPTPAPSTDSSTDKESQEAGRKTLKQILKEDAELNAEAQEMMQARLKREEKYRDGMQKLEQAHKLLQAHYGIEGDVDPEQLAEKIMKDNSLFENMAEELGTTSDIARKLYERDQFVADANRREQEKLEEQTARQHFEKLWAQSEKLKETYPSFDLGEEMKNPAFARMVHPSGGLTVEQAFQALHYQELRAAETKAIEEKVKEELARSIAANQSRPVEGKRAQAASSGTVAPNLSREDREALKREIYAAAYRGEKVYPR